jgi:hypothetical protein
MSAIPPLESSATSHSNEPVPEEPQSKEPHSKFWRSEGMKEFVEWLTEPHNYAKLNNPRPTSGKKVGDIHAEIAKHVNDQCGTDWIAKNVKVKIQYIKRKYDLAAALAKSTGAGDTEESKLREEMLHICPYYDELHQIYATSLSRNPLPPVEFGSATIRHRPPPQIPEPTVNDDVDDSSDFDRDLGDSIDVDSADGKFHLPHSLSIR